MKIFLYISSILTLLSSFNALSAQLGTNEWGSQTNNVQMSIKLQADLAAIKSGQPYSLLICYKHICIVQR